MVYTYYKQIYSQSNLHSNLVIFKCKICSKVTDRILQFTFQSGDIQICDGYGQPLEKEAFTFQSGDIQMVRDTQ